ncbi:MAG: SusC/RagA family TonB-linked outer membrane protein, partial [Flavobacteriaceae bacterium]
FSGILTLLLAFVVQLTFAQEKTISGTVTDDSGLPLPGATVLVKGTTRGASTDFDGNYSINAAQGATLVVSFVGYTTKEVKVGASNTVNAKLSEDAQALEEVVITALGISKEKKAVGYSTESFGGDEIADLQPVNPMTALQGKVSGVDISSAPGPGATQNVVVRGFSTFGDGQPLYIVDGVPFTNKQDRSGDSLNNQVDFGSGINAINPNDIEDLTVLKGAAATALYGSRAANGVIMITTKKGKEGKLSINFDSSFSLDRLSTLPEKQSQFGQGWSGDRALDENGNWGAAYDGVDRVWGNIINNSQKIKPYVYLEDNVRDFFEYGKSYKNALSLSGGNDKTTYFFSTSYNSVDGIIPENKDTYDRLTLSTRGSHKFNKLSINTSVNFANENTSAIPSGQGSSLFRSLYEVANDISIVDLKDYNDPFNDENGYFTPYGKNPYFILNNDGATMEKNKVFGKLEFEYSILDNLKAIYRFGGDFESSIAETHIGIRGATDPDSHNYGSSSDTPGEYSERRRTRIQTNHDFILTWNTSLNSNIEINALGGFNANDRKYNWLEGKITSIDVPGFYDLTNSLTPSVSTQYEEHRRLVGVYANVDISYNDYLYLNLSSRNDWSSTLPPGNNSFFYGGQTLSFLLTDYLKSKNVGTGPFNFTKFRVAYGTTGKDTEPYYVYDRFVKGYSDNPGFPDVDDLGFPLGGTNSYTVSNQRGNLELKPEITSEFEVGVENYMFDNRLGFEFSYYNRFTKDLIARLPLDPSTGYTYYQSNLGDVRNKGVELSVNLKPIKTNDFSWDINWSYTKNKNKVERLDVDEVSLSGFSSVEIYAIEGMALGQFKSTIAKTVTLDDSGNVANTGTTYTVVDGNGNPQATTDQELLGKDINEKYRMGLTNTFKYKGFTLSGTFDFRYGGYMYSYTKDYMHWTGSAPESVLNDRNPFLVPNSVLDNGDGTYRENNIPVDATALHTFYSDGGFQREDYAVIDRSYLKLRNISLGYKLSDKVCEKLKLNAVNFTLTASNFLLWTPAENPYIDPETTTFGNDISAKFGEYGANPTTQTYTFGININL